MSTQYFSDLNYSLGNEDTNFEYQLCQQLRPKKIVSVAGSGGRALPLLSFGAESLIALDLSQQQLFLTSLREQTYRQFSYEEFLQFWGYPPCQDSTHLKERQELFFKLQLSPEVRSYFSSYFERLNWGSLLYQGKWEKTFATLSKIMKKIMGKEGSKILEFDNLAKQQEYYHTKFSHWRWSLVLFLLGNKTVFNALLYKGSFIKKNVPESHYEYYKGAFDNLFSKQLAAESFFLQLCFYGKLRDVRSVPIEARRESFDKIKESLAAGCQVATVQQDILSYLKEQKEVDFVSLSDVPSYFSGATEFNFLQDIRPSLNPGALVVVRSYLRIPSADSSGYSDESQHYQALAQQEKVQMYRIAVFKKI